MDDQKQSFKGERNREPETIDTTPTGTHAAGNYIGEEPTINQQAERIKATGLVWIEREDLRKQGMARKTDLRAAFASPSHPHIGRDTGAEQEQGGRQ